MWSAVVDPRVITVRACRCEPDRARTFDGVLASIKALRGLGHEHLLVERNGILTRLDVIEGTALAGPVSLQFDLPDDCHLDTRIAAIRGFNAAKGSPRPHLQLARRGRALDAVDANDRGASLREIADLILGSGDWPGDGEHRKSLVRRLIANGKRMVRAGPRAILTGDGGREEL